MPTFDCVQVLPFPRAVVFDFFLRPGNMIALAPPQFGLTLVEAPQVVELGSRIVVQARRWGLSQRLITEVVQLHEPSALIEEQRQGPFRSWRHERHFKEMGAETEVSERIHYEPPGGILGLLLTARAIEADLALAYTERPERLRALLERRP
jgi:ligand-binding SRPBCC domain-containing protein